MLNAIRGQTVSRIGRVSEAVATTPESDAELVARAKRDRQHFAALYDRYLDPIFRYCVVRLGSREAAEDATSLIFTKALDALPSCCDTTFRAWLFAIARNVVADCHRASRPQASLDAAGGVADPSPSPDDIAVLRDDETVRGLLAQLPNDQRDVVELRLAGLTGPEIARALGRSHGAIRIAQYRAYARLRSLLAASAALTA
jgi:RNA polymerase sigma-70 factor (ECF subfamily)